MLGLKTIKTTALIGLVIILTSLNFPTKTQAANTDTCVNVSGFYYIIDQYLTDSTTASPYSSQEDCFQAALATYGCIPAINNVEFLGSAGITPIYQINFVTDRLTPEYKIACIASGNDKSNPICDPTKKVFKCVCNESINVATRVIGISRPWRTNSGMILQCGMIEIPYDRLLSANITESMNPAKLIDVSTKLIFAVGVIIFIFNTLESALMYVRSTGEEAMLKQARHTFTRSIIGLLFMFFVSGIILYVYEIAKLP
jgi:hypothetical protein